MLTPPEEPTDDRVAAAVAAHWLGGAVVEVSYLPVGFGAHHWRVVGRDGTAVFATVDAVGESGAGRAVDSLEAAYAGAAALAADGVAAVWPPLAGTLTGRYTAPLGAGAVLSATAWLDCRADAADAADAASAADALRELHAVRPCRGAVDGMFFLVDRWVGGSRS